MSTLTVTTISSANGSTDLTVRSGNTLGPAIIFGANGAGITFQANSTNNQTFVVNSTSVYVNNTSVLSTAVRQQVGTGTGACTTFTVSGGYTANALDVYVNGVKQFASSVNIGSGTNVVFSSAPANGAIIEVVGFTAAALTGGTVIPSGQYTWSNTQTFSNTVTFNSNATFSGNVILNGVYANSSLGSSGQLLTSNGSGVYWSSAGVNTAATYSWTNAHTFSANITVGNVFINTTSIALNNTAVGPTGAGTDAVFFLNRLTVNTSFSIPSGMSAHAVGPITIASGVTVTVPSGSKYVVL